jgi:hypothetical protein
MRVFFRKLLFIRWCVYSGFRGRAFTRSASFWPGWGSRLSAKLSGGAEGDFESEALQSADETVTRPLRVKPVEVVIA